MSGTWRPVVAADALPLWGWLQEHPVEGVVFASALREAERHGFDVGQAGLWVLETPGGAPLALTTTRGVVEVFAPERTAWPALPRFMGPRLAEAPVLLGQAPVVEAVLAGLAAPPGPCVKDERLTVLTLRAEDLPACPETPGFRLAGPADVAEVARQAAAMRAAELGFDPTTADPDASLAGVAWQVLHERVWVLEQEGALVYQVQLGRQTPAWGVLEGAWTNPAHRGRGHGLRGWHAACAAVLEACDGVLAVTREDNAAQLHIEARTGFRALPTQQRVVVWQAGRQG
ncbi:MAG: GNAT family N-acetyltransferase [Candidatus Sericytochromatia bacterium]|nr:GNAT family N-acetyltransferase [Candidatus Sericytochromatia bacterium]